MIVVILFQLPKNIYIFYLYIYFYSPLHGNTRLYYWFYTFIAETFDAVMAKVYFYWIKIDKNFQNLLYYELLKWIKQVTSVNLSCFKLIGWRWSQYLICWIFIWHTSHCLSTLRVPCNYLANMVTHFQFISA